MKGKWAQGLRPRAFLWVITDRVAASERPGGYARNHRKVRRDEELIWLREQGFTHILSLLDSPHNLTAYQDAGLAYVHVPLGRPGSEAEQLGEIYGTLMDWYLDPDEKVLVHYEEFGDRLCGVVGGFLLHAGLIRGEPTAVALTERLTGRQLGPEGRAIVRATIEEGLASDAPPEPGGGEAAPEGGSAVSARRLRVAEGSSKSQGSSKPSGSSKSRRSKSSGS